MTPFRPKGCRLLTRVDDRAAMVDPDTRLGILCEKGAAMGGAAPSGIPWGGKEPGANPQASFRRTCPIHGIAAVRQADLRPAFRDVNYLFARQNAVPTARVSDPIV